MDDTSLAELLRNSPRVDKALIEETLKVLRTLREAGVQFTSLSSSPPEEPYTISRGVRPNWRSQAAK